MAKVVHFEIPVEDPERARAFYSSLFGWQLDSSGSEEYWLATTGPADDPGADGALIRRSELHTHPVIVIGVDSVNECLAAAEPAGGEVLLGKHEIPSIGYSAYLRDPEGNVVGIFEPASVTSD